MAEYKFDAAAEVNDWTGSFATLGFVAGYATVTSTAGAGQLTEMVRQIPGAVNPGQVISTESWAKAGNSAAGGEVFQVMIREVDENDQLVGVAKSAGVALNTGYTQGQSAVYTAQGGEGHKAYVHVRMLGESGDRMDVSYVIYTDLPAEEPTGPTAVPGIPSNVRMEQDVPNNKLYVRWDANPTEDEVLSYQVYFDGSYSFTDVPSTQLELEVPGESGTTHSARVSARNEYTLVNDGYGPWSNSVSGTIPSPQLPPAPDEAFPEFAGRSVIPANAPLRANSAAMCSAWANVLVPANKPALNDGLGSREFFAGPGDEIWTLSPYGKRFYAPAGWFSQLPTGIDATVKFINKVGPDGPGIVARCWGGYSGGLNANNNTKVLSGMNAGWGLYDGNGAPSQGSGTAWKLLEGCDITVEDYDRGVIGHALGVALSNSLNWANTYVAPALAQEQQATGSLIPMGARFHYLGPDVGDPMAATGVERMRRMIVRAAKDHGVYPRDGRPGGVHFYMTRDPRWTNRLGPYDQSGAGWPYGTVRAISGFPVASNWRVVVA